MLHILEPCPLTRLEVGLRKLNSADDYYLAWPSTHSLKKIAQLYMIINIDRNVSILLPGLVYMIKNLKLQNCIAYISTQLCPLGQSCVLVCAMQFLTALQFYMFNAVFVFLCNAVLTALQF